MAAIVVRAACDFPFLEAGGVVRSRGYARFIGSAERPQPVGCQVVGRRRVGPVGDDVDHVPSDLVGRGGRAGALDELLLGDTGPRRIGTYSQAACPEVGDVRQDRHKAHWDRASRRLFGGVGADEPHRGLGAGVPAATGLDTTLRQPDGPSRGSSSTAAPSRRACSVALPIRSTSAYGSHSGRRVWHSMIPAPTAGPRSRAK